MAVLMTSSFLLNCYKYIEKILFFVNWKNNNPKLVKKQQKQLFIIYNHKVICFYQTFIV